MELKIAQRKRAKMKMCLQGPSGSGKTMSALLIAYGLCGDWSKVCVIDTENHSSELYSHLGAYNVITLDPTFEPEKYIQAINLCLEQGIEVIVIDSLTHSWEYLLDFHASLPGNSFTNWSKITPRHNGLMQAILQSQVHVISTIRSKTDYVLTDKAGRMVPEKIGLKGIQRDGIDFEFTISLDLNIKHQAIALKDRTGLFADKPEFKIDIQTGKAIQQWCNQEADQTVDEVSRRINEVKSLQELIQLYTQQNPSLKEILRHEFESRKRTLLINNEALKTLSNTKNISANGTNK